MGRKKAVAEAKKVARCGECKSYNANKVTMLKSGGWVDKELPTGSCMRGSPNRPVTVVPASNAGCLDWEGPK